MHGEEEVGVVDGELIGSMVEGEEVGVVNGELVCWIDGR